MPCKYIAVFTPLAAPAHNYVIALAAAAGRRRGLAGVE